MRKGIKLISIGVLFTISSISVAEDELIDKYKENYIKQVTPKIESAVKAQYGTKMSQKDIDSTVATQAAKVAGCQVIALDYYPKKYRDISIKTIADGMSIPKSNSMVTDELKADIENGSMTQQDFMGMMEKVMGSLKSCIQNG